MAKRKKKFSKALTIFLAILCFCVGATGGFYAYFKLTAPTVSDTYEPSSATYKSGDLVIDFLELGNKYTGDCTYIKVGDTDVLIDAGSKTSSVQTIDNHLKQYVTDGIIEYVIVTHAHEDHYAGFATNEDANSIFDLYECEVIIDFSQITDSKSDQKMYKNYIRERDAEVEAGATHLTARECKEQGKDSFDLGAGVELQILDSYYYYHTSETENDHSVCVMINQGDKHFLFTGDLEQKGEEKLVQMNKLPKVEVYKAGHHGSKTSSSEILMEKIQPNIVCVCCCAGSSEYTKNTENQFPTQAFIDRVAPSTDRVYVTTLCIDYNDSKFESMNGNIRIVSSLAGVSVSCSNNNTILRETAWFKQERTCPDEWETGR